MSDETPEIASGGEHATQDYAGARLQQGARVEKFEGDYTFKGHIAVIFTKRSGAVRLVVENDDGVLMIMNPLQVRGVEP